MGTVELRGREGGAPAGGQPPAGAAGAYLPESCFRGFACPEEKFDEPFFEAVATNYAREVVRIFLATYAAALEREGRGLAALLGRWLAGETTSATVWHPAFGGAFRALSERSGNPLDAAAGLALRLCACGVVGDWEAQLGRPTRLLWWHWLLPRADAIRVRCEERNVRISLRFGRTSREVEFIRTGRAWRCDGAVALPRIGPRGTEITLLPAGGVGAHDFKDLGLPLLEEIGRKDVHVCRRALEILESCAPAYRPWVLRIVRHVALLRPEREVLRSGGANELPGLIYMSCGDRPMPLAEMLVHEASHHYFNLLCRFGSPDDGTDKNLYYSPAVKRPRPLDRILIAYHAFANISRLYQLCLAGGVDDGGYCRAGQADILPQLEQLAAPLRDNPALTPIGRALCEPLFSRLK